MLCSYQKRLCATFPAKKEREIEILDPKMEFCISSFLTTFVIPVHTLIKQKAYHTIKKKRNVCNTIDKQLQVHFFFLHQTLGHTIA